MCRMCEYACACPPSRSHESVLLNSKPRSANVIATFPFTKRLLGVQQEMHAVRGNDATEQDDPGCPCHSPAFVAVGDKEDSGAEEGLENHDGLESTHGTPLSLSLSPILSLSPSLSCCVCVRARVCLSLCFTVSLWVCFESCTMSDEHRPS